MGLASSTELTIQDYPWVPYEEWNNCHPSNNPTPTSSSFSYTNTTPESFEKQASTCKCELKDLTASKLQVNILLLFFISPQLTPILETTRTEPYKPTKIPREDEKGLRGCSASFGGRKTGFCTATRRGNCAAFDDRMLSEGESELFRDNFKALHVRLYW
jgi:hypothetical protein